MTNPRSLQADLDRIAADLAAGDDGDKLPVMVMSDDDAILDDPRLAPLVAQARREGRLVVTPREETEAGVLVDTSAAAYVAAQPAHVIALPRREEP